MHARQMADAAESAAAAVVPTVSRDVGGGGAIMDGISTYQHVSGSQILSALTSSFIYKKVGRHDCDRMWGWECLHTSIWRKQSSIVVGA
jgi:hypothetical protein